MAEVILDCNYVEIGSSGRIGYPERPDEDNPAIIEFLGKIYRVPPYSAV